MAEFVATPYNRPKIPAINVRQFVDALLQYMPTIVAGEYSFQEITCERGEDSFTDVVFYRDGQRRGGLISVSDRALKSLDAKLGSDPFNIHIIFPPEQVRFWATITPREDRSIAIKRLDP